jgi:hypothetical protein
VPMQPTCTKRTALEVPAALRVSRLMLAGGSLGGKGSSARGLSTNSAVEGTGGPAQRALLLAACATVRRLVDAADDLPNAAFEACVYTGSGQRLPLHEVGEEHVLRGFRQVCGNRRVSHGLEDRSVGDGPVEAHLPRPFQHRVPLPTMVRSRASPGRLARHGMARHGVAVALTSPPPNMKLSVTIRYSFSATSGIKSSDGYCVTCSRSR